MDLSAGTRLGPYEILSALGAGGMGEVYRARDTKLDRAVAIKILPDAFAADPDRLARFRREAKTLASLNHPNIGGIHGLEEAQGVTAIVMELVEGEDLAQRIARGAIPLDEALPIARQIAEALEAAHEHGIVHRDLKPANIKVRPDGTVKVLDFGLAKAMEPAPGSSTSASISPTITTPAMTQAGMILGTAAYMSPEQARGKTLDKRTDIWAFGCVLYEMLTGTRAFAGDDVSEVLASVLAREPDWTRLPSNLSPALVTYSRRCLEKNPKQRIADAQDMRLALAGAFDSAQLPSATRLATRAVSTWVFGALVVGATVAGAAVWVATRPPAQLQPHVSRLQVVPTGTAALTLTGSTRDLAITPDGSHVVYVANRGTQLLVRAMDSLDPVAVFTGLPRGPFVSPDGQWTAFTDGGVLKKVPVSGGPAVPITPIDAPTARGGTWGPDDTIVFATTNGATGLQRVAAQGGAPTVLTRPEVEEGEADHAWPEWLPGGKAVLFTILARNGGLDAAQVAVLDLGTGKSRVLLRGGSHAHYVPGEVDAKSSSGRDAGHLIFATAGTLRAVRFDLERLQTLGTPVAVVHDVVTTPSGDVNAVVTVDGTLVYVPGPPSMPPDGRLTWVDRRGVETLIPAPPRAYGQPRLSPDGKRVAVFVVDQELDLWLSDLGPTLTRLTSGPGVDAFPVWTPDGHRLIFSSQSTSAGNLFSQAADGAGVAERLTESPNLQVPTGISADGRTLIFTETFPKTGADIMQLDLNGSRRVSALVQSEFTERNGIISPDGQWLAYESNEDSVQFEIFVRPFPDVNRGRFKVSTAGGTRPLWARNGRELIYVSPSGALMAAGAARGPTWAATTSTLVVKEGYMVSPGNFGRTYDTSPDGQRFLMIKGRIFDAAAAPGGLIVVQHWVEELRRLVPTK